MEKIVTLLGMPPRASQSAEGTDSLIAFIHLLMFALFVGWLAYFLYALWRFNKVRNPKADYQGVKNHASSYIEVMVAGIEAVLLVFVAVPLWWKHTREFPKESEATVVQVVGQQFNWNFRYPGKDATFGRQDMSLVTSDNIFGIDPADPKGKDDVQVINEMHVVVNKPVIAYISSKDVIHSFKLPTMRITQDAIPGQRVPVWFLPNQEGTNQIFCAQLCGNGHASMAGGRLVVQSQEAFDKWLAGKTGAATSFE